jgi:hypothetical protein
MLHIMRHFLKTIITMARIKLGAIISSISGSMGGTTFQKNAYGMTMRNKPYPIHINNTSTSLIQQYLAYAQFLWRYMNDEQKGNFDRFSQFHPQYANHNKSSLLSGYNLFMKYALLAQCAGYLPNTSIKFVVPPFTFTQPTLRKVGTDLIINCGVVITNLDYIPLVKFSRPYSRNKFIPVNAMRVVKYTGSIGADMYFIGTYEQIWGMLPGYGDFLLVEITMLGYDAPVIYPTWRGILEVTV